MEPTTAPSKMRMEGWRQIGDWLAKQRETAERTWQEACHFLHRYYMDHHHPSRLPDGSLRSAWTGPGHDPKRSLIRENGRYWNELLTPTGFLMEGPNSFLIG